MNLNLGKVSSSTHCKEVRFASFLSGGFSSVAVMHQPEKKLEKPLCIVRLLHNYDTDYIFIKGATTGSKKSVA